MKKYFLLIAVAAIFMCSCRSHGPLCPAYSSVKKAQEPGKAVVLNDTEKTS